MKTCKMDMTYSSWTQMPVLQVEETKQFLLHQRSYNKSISWPCMIVCLKVSKSHHIQVRFVWQCLIAGVDFIANNKEVEDIEYNEAVPDSDSEVDND